MLKKGAVEKMTRQSGSLKVIVSQIGQNLFHNLCWNTGEGLLAPIFVYPSRFFQAGREPTRKPILQLSNFSHRFRFYLFCSRSFYLVSIKGAFNFPLEFFPLKYPLRIRIVKRDVGVGLGLIGIIFLEIDVISTLYYFRLCLHWGCLGI